MTKLRTMFDKIWDSHLVDVQEDGTCLLYIDRHLVHEVTSPQAFEGLALAGRKVRRTDLTLAVADHNVPTTDRSKGIIEEESRIQVEDKRLCETRVVCAVATCWSMSQFLTQNFYVCGLL